MGLRVVIATAFIVSCLCESAFGQASAAKEIADLKAQVAALKAKLTTLENSYTALNGRVVKLQLAEHRYKSVVLDLTSHAFKRLDTDLGTFLVSVENVTPYLDGYRVVLRIGNPSFVTFEGFTLRTEWNVSFDKAKDWDAWQKTNHQKDVSFTERLQPGTWNRVELLLAGTKPDELGWFLLSMEMDSVALHKP